MQVITVAPDGGVSGLQVKPGKGLNLQSLGRASTVRASEIVWDEDAQAWKVDVLQEAGKGVITFYKTEQVGSLGYADMKALAPTMRDVTNGHEPLLFGDYDDAVKVEIAFLDALRIKGQF